MWRFCKLRSHGAKFQTQSIKIKLKVATRSNKKHLIKNSCTRNISKKFLKKRFRHAKRRPGSFSPFRPNPVFGSSTRGSEENPEANKATFIFWNGAYVILFFRLDFGIHCWWFILGIKMRWDVLKEIYCALIQFLNIPKLFCDLRFGIPNCTGIYFVFQAHFWLCSRLMAIHLSANVVFLRQISQ